MDSLPKKRKLIECGTNFVSPVKKPTFTKPSNLSAERKHKAFSKIHRVSQHNNLNVLVAKQEHLCLLFAIMPRQKIGMSYLVGGHKGVDEHRMKKSIFSIGIHSLKILLAEYGGVTSGMSSNKEKYLLNKNGSTKYSENNMKKTDHVSERGSRIFEETMIANMPNTSKDIIWFSTDYIEDIISHELFKESLYKLSDNFCKEYDINPTGREILVDWLISVQVHLKAENSILHLAVALLDIVLDSVPTPLNELQASAVASFWVAYKFICGNIGMKTLLNLCAGSVTKEMIEENEILVLQKSRLIQAGGSLSVFFNYLLYKIFGFEFPLELYYCGMYFLEIMLLKFIFVDYRSYEKAVTALFTSLNTFRCSHLLETVDVSRFITKKRLHHSYRRLVYSLKLMYSDEETLKKSSVYKKYKSSRYQKISVHQNLLKFLSVT